MNMRKGLIALLACVIPGFCTGLWAGSRTEDSASGFSLRRYEFSVSGAAYPGYCAFGYDFNYPYYQYNIENIYTRFAYDERETSTGTWTAAFTYNFTKILALETSISYEGGRLRNSRKPDAVGIISPGPGGDMPDLTESLDYFTPMAALRVSWLNKKIVRMYSSFGAGLSFCARKGTGFSNAGKPNGLSLYPAFQLNPVGLSVGGNFFGTAELGFGSLFCGLRLGAGYRF